jgi:hypothetical protein
MIPTRRDSASRHNQAHRAMRGFKMTVGERPRQRKLAFQIVRLKIQQIFEECSKFEERDKNALYEAIGNLLLQRIRPAEARTPADKMPAGFGELTDAAAMDDFTRPSKDCTNSSGRMSRLPMVDVNAAFPK